MNTSILRNTITYSKSTGGRTFFSANRIFRRKGYLPTTFLSRSSSLQLMPVSLSSWYLDQRRSHSFESNENPLKKSELYSIIKDTSSEGDVYAPFFPTMIFAVKKGDYELAKTTCENFHPKTFTRANKSFPAIYNLYFSLFQSKEQLPHLQALVNDFRNLNIPLSEITYLSLIRCHCDAGDIATAWKYMEEMNTTGFENRVRVFTPFFDAYARTLQFDEQMMTVAYMREHKLQLREDQLESILCTFARLRHHNPQKAAETYPKLSQFLHSVADFLQGIRGDQLSVLASIVNNCSVQDIARMGLLISSKEEMTGAIISDANLTTDGSILAYNISFQSATTNSPLWSHETLPIPRSADPYLPETMRQYDRLEFLPEKFIVKSARESALLSLMAKSSVNEQVVNTDVDDHKDDASNNDTHSGTNYFDTHIEATAGTPVVATMQAKVNEDPLTVINRTRQWMWEKNLDARLVSIPASSSRCPHCDGQVNNIPLREDEKKELRQALFNVVEKDSSKAVSSLKEFEAFLTSQQEFEYIIDGANVAYNNQNYEMGRFSYGQIRLVVEELQRIGKRVLVIMPSTYADTSSLIPNRVRNSFTRTLPLKANEIAFINQLKENKMLFVVPKGMNDDIFWMMAAVHENRKHACFVVTNDLMRDHAIATFAQSSFARLRTSSLVYFSIFRDDTMRPILKQGTDNFKTKNNTVKNHSQKDQQKRLSAENLAKHNRSLDKNSDKKEEDGEDDEEGLNYVARRITNPLVTFIDGNFIREALSKIDLGNAKGSFRGHNNNKMQSQKASNKTSQTVVQKKVSKSGDKLNMEDEKDEESDLTSSVATDDSEYEGNAQSMGRRTNFGGELPPEFCREKIISSADTNNTNSDSSDKTSNDHNTHVMIDGKMESIPPLVAERKEMIHRSKIPEETTQRKSKFRELLAVDDLNWSGQVTFFKPGNYSRDIQESAEHARWHIPATDAMKWLCVKFKPGDK